MLSQKFQNGTTKALKFQLQILADKWKNRSQHPASELADEKEDLVLMESDFMLKDMVKLLYYMDPKHLLLVTASKMKVLGSNQEDGNENEDVQ